MKSSFFTVEIIRARNRRERVANPSMIMRLIMLLSQLMALAAASREQVLVDLDPGGLVWTGLDVDDDLALLMAVALNRTAKIDLSAVTVCGGNAPLKHTAPGLALLFEQAGINPASDLPHGVAHGKGWRDMHVAWPRFRQLNYWSPDVPSSDDAADLIIRAARASGPDGLTIVTLGPASNLAAALAKEPTIVERLRRVVLMGGELTGSKMCLNFMSDRAAARAVLAAPVPTVLVPIQLCAQAAFTAGHVADLEQRCGCRPSGSGGDSGSRRPAAACALVRKMQLQTRLMPWLVNKHVVPKLSGANSRWRASEGLTSESFVPWDVVAMLVAFRPELFEAWEAHAVHIPSCDSREPCNGIMEVNPSPLWGVTDSKSDGAGEGERGREQHRNVALIPHRMRSEAAVLEEATELLCSVPAATHVDPARPVALLLGFGKEAIWLALGTAGVGVLIARSCLKLGTGGATA